jgi:hypothetical protein
MKKIKMQISEFLQFRQTCELYRIFFTYGIKRGEVTVKADPKLLAQIGY